MGTGTYLKKAVLGVGVLVLTGLLFFPSQARAGHRTVLHLFYGEGCPHCAKAKLFLPFLEREFGDDLVIRQYEVYGNQDNLKKLTETAERLGESAAGVPFMVIGEKHLVGYASDQITGKLLESYMADCVENGCPDILAEAGAASTSPTATEDPQITPAANSGNLISVPLLGKIDPKTVSLPLVTVAIALADGFNPCAMWVLVFLITLLVNLKDRRRLYVLGSLFLAASAGAYFLFLTAWLNIFALVGYLLWIRSLIAIAALLCGGYYVYRSVTYRGGCAATDERQRRSITERAKHAVTERSFLLAAAGIIVLAASVNIVELACSAGLPAVYTGILSASGVSGPGRYAYLLLYILVFMIDDLFVFFTAVRTLEVTGILSKYTRAASLAGGLVILLIGVLLIVSPGTLMMG